jgi:ADP-dependent NAD(P)H-hydrate dehydratase / NAD(P)H-hydrate epimerase
LIHVGDLDEQRRLTHPFVLSAGQMRAVDRAAIEHTGLPSVILMENAGRGVAEAVLRRVPAPASRALLVAVACGGGNNGGDGFVVARHLALRGVQVRVLLAVARAKLTGDAATNLRALEGLAGISVADFSGSTQPNDWQQALSGVDVILDALFGTGLNARIAGAPEAAIAAINAAPVMKVAVDIPSGLDADTGQARGPAVRADVTLTMGARKLGLVIDPDVKVGEIEVVDLGVPIAPPPQLGPFGFWLEEPQIQASLPRRQGSAHKGRGGHLVIVAGSAGKTGAALLASRAALRSGAGLVTVASTPAGQVALDAKVVEAMTIAFSRGDDADDDSFNVLETVCAGASVRAMALGPGIPLGPGMRGLVERLVSEIALPMVIDADGLNLLVPDAARILAGAPAARVVTPHPGEMARLCGRTTAEVQSNRLAVAREFAAASGAIVVLKGARTLVVAPDGRAFINPAVEPALATAGSGDVLTGILGGLIAQGMGPIEAACAAVFLHGRAGSWAARIHGTPGVVAGDLPDAAAAVRAAWANQ